MFFSLLQFQIFTKTESISGINTNTHHEREREQEFIMGKKSRDENALAVKKGKKGRIPFRIFNEQFDNLDASIVKRHIFYIIFLSVLTKIVVMFLTTSVFHSFIDLFDFGYYFEHGMMVVDGQVPYLNFPFDYPPLALVPILFAIIPAILTTNQYAFVFTFQALMIICDIGTVLCIYFIGLKIFDEKKAFYAALIYSAAFSTAYFVLTKYDAFPTFLLMVAVLFTIYGMNMKGYLADTAGILAKIFPVIALPFIVLYNARKTSLKEEILQIVKFFIPLFILVVLPILILKPEIISQYFSASLVRGTVYVNTPTYVLYAFFHEMLKIDVSIVPDLQSYVYIDGNHPAVSGFYCIHTGKIQSDHPLETYACVNFYCCIPYEISQPPISGMVYPSRLPAGRRSSLRCGSVLSRSDFYLYGISIVVWSFLHKCGIPQSRELVRVSDDGSIFLY